jgi:hypothetical protein
MFEALEKITAEAEEVKSRAQHRRLFLPSTPNDKGDRKEEEECQKEKKSQ